MNREVQALLVLMVGVVTLRLSATDAFLNYVKASMRPWLLLSGAMLAALAAVMLWKAIRSGHDHHGHGAPKVAWLLLLPVLAVFVVPIDPLGSFAAARGGARPIEVDRKFEYPPMPEARDGAVDLPILDFVDRAFYDEQESLRDVPVRITGFVSPTPEGRRGDFLLSRFVLNCCAADAMAIQIAILGVAGPTPSVDTWVEVVGVWEPWEDEPDFRYFIPNMAARQVVPIPQPVDPYANF